MEIIDFLPDPLLISKFDGHTHHPVFLNQKFTEVIGYTLAELPDIDTWFNKAYPEEAYKKEIFATWEEKSAEAKISGSNFVDVKAKIRCKDNKDKWFHVRATFWKQDIYIVVFSNIDAINLKNEELENLNALKDKLFTVISHDLRSPLASLKSLLNLVDMELISEKELKKMLPPLREQLHNVSVVLETLLNWAKSQLQKRNTNPTEFNIEKMVTETLALLQPEAKRKNILLHQVKDDGICAFADMEMVSIVLYNLVANAIKFTPSNGRVSVRAECSSDYATIAVKDNGVGLSEEQQLKFTERKTFTSSGTNNEKGTGLGLLFCHEFINQNGGTLSVMSSLNTGTEFSFTLPLKTQ
jgi:two-component system, sensor histidine kinase and response regulator